MENKKVWAKGVVAFPKHERAPEWVVGSLVITPNDLVSWLKSEGEQYLTEYKGNKQLRLQITKTKDNKLSVSVDTWKPDASKSNNLTSKKQFVSNDESDLPF